MKLEEIIKGLEIEKECVSRDCDRDFANCDIVQEKDWLLDVYQSAINTLKEQNEALKLMAFQYCTMGFGNDITFNNRCMTAGEHAFKTLGIENGQKAPEDWIN